MASVIDIYLEGDDAWPDLKERADMILVHRPIGIAVLPHGMTSGNASVAFRLDLPDGSCIIAESSLKLFAIAAESIKIRYADEWERHTGK